MTRLRLFLLLALLAAPAWAQGNPEDAIRQAFKGPVRVSGAQSAGQALVWDGTAWIASDQAASSGSGDLTAITETGAGITITNGTGPIPDLALHADLEELIDHWTLDTSGNLDLGSATLQGPLLQARSTSAATLATFMSGQGLSTANTLSVSLSESALVHRAYSISSTGADYGQPWQFVRYRGTVASPAIVQADDLVASIQGRAAGANALGSDLPLAAILMEVDGAPGVADMPGRIRFMVTPDGGTTSAEAVRISNTKAVTFASSIAATTSNTGASVSASGRYSGTVTAMAASAVDFTASPVITRSVTGNLTLTTTIDSLPASGAASTVTVVLTADGSGPYTLGFPSAWGWLGTKPTSLAASAVGVLQLIAVGNTEAGVIACYSVKGSGS